MSGLHTREVFIVFSFHDLDFVGNMHQSSLKIHVKSIIGTDVTDVVLLHCSYMTSVHMG